MGNIRDYWRDQREHKKNMRALKNCPVATSVWNQDGNLQKAKMVAANCSKQHKQGSQYGSCQNINSEGRSK